MTPFWNRRKVARKRAIETTNNERRMLAVGFVFGVTWVLVVINVSAFFGHKWWI